MFLAGEIARIDMLKKSVASFAGRWASTFRNVESSSELLTADSGDSFVAVSDSVAAQSTSTGVRLQTPPSMHFLHPVLRYVLRCTAVCSGAITDRLRSLETKQTWYTCFLSKLRTVGLFRHHLFVLVSDRLCNKLATTLQLAAQNREQRSSRGVVQPDLQTTWAAILAILLAVILTASWSASSSATCALVHDFCHHSLLFRLASHGKMIFPGFLTRSGDCAPKKRYIV